jgi:MoaA/NifB/PqqE/SkfB family radical SAM enzyme
MFRSNPYLHIDAARIYNPLTDEAVGSADSLYAAMTRFLAGAPPDSALVDAGWVIEETTDLSRNYLLKIVSLETMTTCNQKCYFCPVSVAPREDEEMPTELFDRIVEELGEFRPTLQGIFLQSYNEPTLDRRFVELCTKLFAARLPVAVLTNGSGLTPRKADAIMSAGTLRYLCINLSTLDREKYEQDRGEDHLGIVLRNLEYLRDKPLASEMRIVVLGEMDEQHERDFESIRDRFAGSLFDVQKHHATDRAGWLEVGMKTLEPKKNLAGCELMGSRPIQHLHVTPAGACIICCQDYDENYVVGDLTWASIRDVLAGEEMARIRRWTYGVEEAPADFICRTCVFALTR